jgi:hypothetical protein
MRIFLKTYFSVGNLYIVDNKFLRFSITQWTQPDMKYKNLLKSRFQHFLKKAVRLLFKVRQTNKQFY